MTLAEVRAYNAGVREAAKVATLDYAVDATQRRILALIKPEPVGKEIVAPTVTAERDGEWSYDFGPRKVPNGLIEVAFEAWFGDFHVRICERVITRSKAADDRPLPIDQYEYGYFDEYRKDVSNGRPYAWRKITVPASRAARAAITAALDHVEATNDDNG